MEYMNDSYQYSTDNINGNVKPVSHDKSPNNNNQSDTQIWDIESSWEYLCIPSHRDDLLTTTSAGAPSSDTWSSQKWDNSLEVIASYIM